MQSEGGGSQQWLKVINRMALVRHLCARPGLSRADLAQDIGLTKSTISSLTRELINEGWLMESSVVATGDLGRRPTPLFINPERLLLLGAEVGIDGVRVVATALTGEVRARAVCSYGNSRSPSACIGVLAAVLLKVQAQLAAHQTIIGMGIGLPGGVDEAAARLHMAPNLGWRDVAVGELLADRLAGSPLAEVPMHLQNEADVAAIGEMEFNPADPPHDPLLYVSINQGLGAGVIVGDRLLTGSRGFAGEVGHMVLQMDGPPCSCGRRGCAEALISLRALAGGGVEKDRSHVSGNDHRNDHRNGIVSDSRNHTRNDRDSDKAEPSAEHTANQALAGLRRRLLDQDRHTQQTVAAAGRHLGMLLQNLATAYDPACIVLGGAVVELGDPFLTPALDTLQQYADAANMPPPLLRISRFGPDAVAVGAAALARYRVTRPRLPHTRARWGASATDPTTEESV